VSTSRAYRCLNCLEHTLDRGFDASHLSVSCPNCGSFERFVNDAVFQQFEAFEASPPSELDWERLDRTEKLVVAERLVRSTKTLDDFEVTGGEAEEDGAGTADTGGEPEDGDRSSERATDDVVATETGSETASLSARTASRRRAPRVLRRRSA